MKKEVKDESKPGVQGKRTDRGHASQGAQEGREPLGGGSHHHGRADVAQDAANVLLDRLALAPGRTLVRVDEYEDVVRPDGEDEERYDLDDDEGRGDADVGEEADGRGDGGEDDDDASEPERDLAVDEQRRERLRLGKRENQAKKREIKQWKKIFPRKRRR